MVSPGVAWVKCAHAAHEGVEEMEANTVGFVRRLRFSTTVLLLALALLIPSAFVAASAPPFHRYLSLDGNDDYADASDHSELDVGQSLTIEAWVNIQPGTDNAARYIVRKDMAYELSQSFDPGHQRCIGFLVYFSSGYPRGYIHCRYRGYGYGWHHVAGVYDKATGEARIYLDGKMYGNANSFGVSDLYNSAYPVKVGQHFAAGIDEIRISDVVRYSADFTPPTGPFACDGHTRALWHFDETAGATVFHDACGTDNVLQGHNGAHTDGPTLRRTYLPIIRR